jgi:cation-transporting P-type ATPase 13A2
LGVNFLNNTSYLQIQSTKRDEVEKNLHFLGFLIMENKLKGVTRDIISTLNECNIRTIMATGDNTLTAISVGRDCNILHKYHDVYFPEIHNGEVVWKNEVSNSECDDPFLGEIKDFGVALNGQTLAFLFHNREEHEAVLQKIL